MMVYRHRPMYQKHPVLSIEEEEIDSKIYKSAFFKIRFAKERFAPKRPA
jgi:hypothetical protein